MTTEISDEAIRLRNELAQLYRPHDWANSEWQPVFLAGDALLQTALTAARNSALEDAANVAATMAERPFDSEPEFSACLAVERAIRAMKVTP